MKINTTIIRAKLVSYLILLWLSLVFTSGYAQSVSPNKTATQLASALVGSGVTVSNATLNCPGVANGTFTSLGAFGNGILLTTGSASGAANPASYFESTQNLTAGDADLTTLSGNSTYDACVLEFDFVPTGDSVKFRYEFGSEEYPNFTCDMYNDVFAFYISGPGYSSPTNIALVPGTNIPVAINSINGGSATGSGNIANCNAMGPGSPFPAYFINNVGGGNPAYDGLTTILDAKAAVTACSTYHFKLAIADASDYRLSSGVFIEQASLSVLPPTIVGCPSNIIVNTGPGSTVCGQNATWTPPTAPTNSCSPAPTSTHSHSPGDFFPVGTTTVTYTFTNAGGTSTCSFNVIVKDNTPPTVTCPPNTIIACTASTLPANTGTATASDNCTGATVAFTDAITPGNCAGNYIINRTWKAIDGSGNTSVNSCVQTITVQDLNVPVITCPANVSIACSADNTPAGTGTATATDGCSGATVTYLDAITPGNCAGNYVINRTWKATDGCNNISTCIQTITVQDVTGPVITCPANATISCSASTTPTSTGVATATDGCSGALVTFTDAITMGNCASNYTIARTWKATDGCGNISTCVQTITIQNNSGPAITCPANVTIACTADNTPAGTGTATATGNCAIAAAVTYTDVITPGNCAGNYVISRTWKATDACNNASTCVQTITVQDIGAPVITCPANVTIACTASTLPANTGTATATDGCSGATVTYTDATTPGNCAGNYVIARTWKATDGCNNASTCVQTITVQDVAGPAITCPPNTTIACTASTLPATTGTATATYGCSGATVSYTDATTPGTCAGNYTIARTWRAVDGCNNVSTCIQTITVQDITGPVITCPANVSIACTASNAPATTGVATATDGCSGATVTFSDVVAAGSCAGNYTIARTWKATDGCGNMSTCVQTITVQNNAAPGITCPANVTVACTASTLPANTGTATAATGSCSGVAAITYTDATTPANCAGNYVISRTWKATDACNNISTCVQTITVQDNVAPVINCPANVTITCTASTLPANTGTATATDGCSGATVTYTDVTTPGGCAGRYVISRTWKATDACSNASTCIQTITVQDITAPTITCPAGVTIACGASTLPASTGTATATDVCSGATVTYTDATTPGNCAGSYVITRTWKAIDGCNNANTCIQTITVQDNVAPVITCPANVTVGCTATLPSGTGTATATDGCSAAIITYTDATTPGDCPGSYVINRTWKATDGCNNASTCVQTITVQDNTAPVITCPPTVIVSCSGDKSPATTGTATATDDCSGVATITHCDFFATGSCANTYLILRIWFATDNCGNTSTCTQNVIVKDQTAPVITCPANITIACTANSTPSGAGTATAIDNCGPATVTYTDVTTPGNCTGNYVITRTWKATDVCNNASTCVQTITVQDLTGPAITCPANVTIACTASTLPANTGTATAIDGCSAAIVTYADVITAGNCASNYTIARTWRAVDACNNASTCVQTISVQDNTGPTITCPSNVTIACTASTLPANTGTASATDNCSGVASVNYTDVTTAGNCAGNYVINRTWRATDACGNASTCIQTITVQDVTAPAITCPAGVTIACGASILPANTGTATATDGCSGATVTYTDVTTAGSCAGNYTITRTWKATDACNNASTCTQTIVVRDVTAPVITCPANVTLACGASVLPAATGTATATDGCSGATVTYTDVVTAGTCAGNYSIARTWKATDGCNNISTCIQTITVRDQTAPVITCPASKTIACTASMLPANTGTATATDGCSGATVTYTDVITAGSCAGNYTIARTWKATDGCGNAATCVQTITVQDLTGPAITCPAAKTIACGASTLPANTGTATVTDGCSAATLAYTDVTTTGSCPGNYSIARTWKATDGCGNISTCVQTITVQDLTPPTAICKNVTVTLVNGTATVTAAMVNNGSTDNCSGVTSLTLSKTTFNCTNIGNNTVTLTVKDACGNQSTCTSVVTVVGALPTCSIGVAPCNTTYTGGVATNIYIGYGPQTATLTANATGTGTFTYLWSGPTSKLSCTTCKSPVFSPTSGGTYTYTVTIKNSYGCTSTCSVTFCVKDIRVACYDDDYDDENDCNDDDRDHHGNRNDRHSASYYSDKIYICHVPPSCPANAHTMYMSASVAAYHLSHHSNDDLGKCDQTCGSPVNARMANEPAGNPAEELAIKAYPNPFNDGLHITIESSTFDVADITVTDLMGRKLESTLTQPVGSEIVVGRTLAPGIYIVTVMHGDVSRQVKVVKLQ